MASRTGRLVAVASAVVLAAGAVLAGQGEAPRASGQIPRTPEGRPDFQGMWTNATVTTMERPADLEGKPTLPDAEAAAYAKKFLEANTTDRRPEDPRQDVGLAYQDFYIDRGTELAQIAGKRRTSLIVDPPDGKIPALTPAARARRAPARPTSDAGETAGGTGAGAYDNVEQRPLAERCLLAFSSSSGPPMLPVLYNNHYQIVQTPKDLMILVEMVHDARIVRLNGTKAPPHIRRWMGDSVARWDGDTLVIETTNFTDKTRFRGSTDALKVTERLAFLDANTILYRFTIDDPTTWVRPWTGEMPFRRTTEPLYEYACHEGNYALGGIMRGARLLENEAAGKAK